MATYQETLTNVRNWMDRDSTVVSDSLLLTFLQYSADKAYRTLRVPSLETTLDFTVTTNDLVADASAGFGKEVSMSLPSDLIEVIYIQKKGTGIVWNQKVDPRTFHDRYADKKDSNYYTRIGSNFLLHGSLGVDDVLEVCYYKRLPKINATYDITVANYLAQTATLTTMTRRANSYTNSDAYIAGLGRTSLYFASGTTTSQIDALSPTAAQTSSGTVDGVNYNVAAEMEPAYIANWLRDENERILLYGSLAEAFSFLEDPAQMQLYEAKFTDEIQKLNAEEKSRLGAGGNTSVSFSGMGLI